MMQVGDYGSPAYLPAQYQNAPYAPSLATLASLSSQSVCSDSSSQASDDYASTTASSVSSALSDSDSCESYCLLPRTSHGQASCNQSAFSSPQWKHSVVPAPTEPAPLSEQKVNPRRTGHGPTTRSGCPPALVRQSDRKVNFVDSLVDSATQIVETIWPLSSVACKSEMGSKGILPLRTFIQETLRRSRTSYSTLQVALYYLILVKPHVPSHDFTMEQPDDVHASRVLQCGRRMFLAALILASKYLQDRNFSARAWSKISGLNTKEINQNEIAFLFAVGWKLHITDEVFQRWTEIVLKFTPHPHLVSSGSPSRYAGLEWKQVIMQLNPELDNVDGLISHVSTPKREAHWNTFSTLSRADSRETISPLHRSYSTPVVLEPNPASVYSNPGRFAPSLGLLPTPRLTPQSTVYNTPAVSAATMLLSKNSSMAMAMSQVPSLGSQSLDRWPLSTTSSPCHIARRSSLATSVSTASSPESMISDSSRASRSSSISSASSLVSAPSTKLDVQARCRYAKLRTEGYVRPTIITSVTEEYDNCLTSSPETYDGYAAKDLADMDIGVADAARALQSLHNSYAHSQLMTPSPTRAGSKRSRSNSVDDGVQDNVRSLLRNSSRSELAWSNSLVREKPAQVSTDLPSRKRLCCSAEASLGYVRRISSLHPLVGGAGGPGMWTGILDD